LKADGQQTTSCAMQRPMPQVLKRPAASISKGARSAKRRPAAGVEEGTAIVEASTLDVTASCDANVSARPSDIGVMANVDGTVITHPSDMHVTTSVDGTTCMDHSNIDITLNLTSGETLTAMTLRTTCTGADIKRLLGERLRGNMRVNSLLVGSQIVADTDKISDLGLASGAVFQVVVSANRPALHLFKPCSATAFSSRHLSWNVGGNSDDEGSADEEAGASDEKCGCSFKEEILSSGLCLKGTQHLGMNDAPKAARNVAEEMQAALGGGKLNLARSSECPYDSDEIIVISGGLQHLAGEGLQRAEDKIELIARALALAKKVQDPDGQPINVWGEATVDARSWSQDVIGGYSRSDADATTAAAITDVMAKRLSDHFEFNLSDKITVGPTIFGGVLDRSIVGMLSGRVWT